MKSRKLILISLLTFFCFSLDAQLFVGGNFRFNTSNTRNDANTTPYKASSYDLYLGPNAGYFFTEKLAAGMSLDFSFSGNKTELNSTVSSASSDIGISPFLRYYAFRWNKFSIYGQGNVGIGFTRSKVKSGGTITEGPKETQVSLSFYPGLSYDISDKFSLQTSLNILSFGYNYSITNQGSSKTRSSGFNVGGGLGNILTLGAITIGAIYKF